MAKQAEEKKGKKGKRAAQGAGTSQDETRQESESTILGKSMLIRRYDRSDESTGDGKARKAQRAKMVKPIG